MKCLQPEYPVEPESEYKEEMEEYERDKDGKC